VVCKSQRIRLLKQDPYNLVEDCPVQFRLTYEGILLGSSRTDTRAAHKQDIRRVFHRQLKRLWAISPHLADSYRQPLPDIPFSRPIPEGYTRINQLAERYQCGPYRLVPIVTEELALACHLKILLLRPDKPGAIVASGDIDNRLKTLFDALRIPGPDKNELAEHTPQEGEDPFFCLLQDDKLINQLSLETDVLLQPTRGVEFDPNDSRIVISVSIRPAEVMLANLSYA
jgi:hypothetical protein